MNIGNYHWALSAVFLHGERPTVAIYDSVKVNPGPLFVRFCFPSSLHVPGNVLGALPYRMLSDVSALCAGYART